MPGVQVMQAGPGLWASVAPQTLSGGRQRVSGLGCGQRGGLGLSGKEEVLLGELCGPSRSKPGTQVGWLWGPVSVAEGESHAKA